MTQQNNANTTTPKFGNLVCKSARRVWSKHAQDRLESIRVWKLKIASITVAPAKTKGPNET